MKKYVVYVVIALFSVSLGVIMSQQLKSSAEPKVMLQPEMHIQQSSFNPAMAVKGPDFREAAQRSVDAAVHIRSQFSRKSSGYDDFFGSLRDLIEGNQNQERVNRLYIGYGSGVIISKDGYIVTNNHVVEGASKIEVTLNDKQLFEAELIGADPSTDLALIKIDEKSLPFLSCGDSDEVVVGEWVLAVGNPFNLTSTVTAGIVSAKARNINILGSNTAIESFIQTDAVVNRGNSGGALVNESGELVGINAAIASHSGSYEGYSFAIPINIVKKVVADLKEFGAIQRAFMGVTIRELNADLANQLGISTLNGVYINSVSADGGAEKAGIRSRDIITSVDGMTVNSSSELLEILGQHRPGDRIDVSVIRDDEQLSYQVLLQNENGSTELNQAQLEFDIESLGVTLGEVPLNERNRLRINNGLKVNELRDGLLRTGGVREGFIILSINDQRIRSRSDIENALRNRDGEGLRIGGIYPNGMRIIYGFE